MRSRVHKAFFLGTLALFFLSVFFLTVAGAAAEDRPPFDNGRAAFAVRVGSETIPYSVFAFPVMPSEEVQISVVKPDGGDFSARFSAEQSAPGQLTARQPSGRWLWRAAAEPGLYPLTIERSDGASLVLNFFVLVPLTEARDGRLLGYRLGKYPDKPFKNLAAYRPPRGFMVITAELEKTKVSPHFTAGQFLCKQAGGHPKLIALRPRLLLKLEYLLQMVNRAGYRADTFAVLSGFRTPAYNQAIGNVRYSRHQWGGAADIFIDESPKDGRMDDLDGDGVIDARDANLLYDLIEGLAGREEYEGFIGGLGKYGTTPAHGPFVHVDARGFRARWGR